MSLYGDYIKERLGKGILENDDGFAVYIIKDGKCYIEEIYVKPEMRNKVVNGVVPAVDLANNVFAIAKESGCKVVFGSVVPSLPCATENTLSLIRYGFKVISSTENFILFEKGVE